ncbi:hypothetical protein ACO2Q3_17120 [Caulobacter sp. KR2-114]|uniref:hypothetical protein n=1 Tax=Caulobacter sp. KR2-114 TaxID=3400912 RepID=UPI003C0E9E9C
MAAVADRIAMLLSADWFAEAARRNFPILEGLEGLREECRSIVKGFMRGEEVYWCVDFSKERVFSTVNMLSSAIDRNVSGGYIDFVAKDIIEYDINPSSFGGAVPQYTDFCRSVMSGNIEYPANESRSKLVSEIFNEMIVDVDFDLLRQNSGSPWDSWLVSLTSDIPSYLSDFMSESVVGRIELFLVWSFIRERYDAQFLSEFTSWVSAEMSRLCGREVSPPKWM